MKITVSLSNRKLQHYLEKCGEACSYIYLGEREADISHSLDLHHFEEITLNTYDDSSREQFLQSYIDLMGKLGAEHDSIYWWSTFTASKNRFASRLCFNLFLFSSVISKLRTDPKHDLLIINPPKEICSSLKQYCAANSIGFKLLHNRLSCIIDIPKYYGKQMVSNAFSTVRLWRNMHIAKKYFKKRFTIEVRTKNKCYVLRSWFYSNSITAKNEYNDSFFGKLPGHLVQKGKNLIVIAGIIGNYKSIAKAIAANNDYTIFPQEFFLRYRDPIRAVVNIYTHKITLKGDIDFEGLDVSDIIKSSIKQDFGNAGILENYIYYFWMKRLVATIDVDTFTTTCENNPWERMCIMALRRHSPGTTILGYQHTVVPQASANMFISKYEKDIVPMPDKILTVGVANKRIMERYGAYDSGEIEEACALRFEYLFNIQTRPRSRSNRILVALEGVFDVYHMVNYTVKELKESSDYKIKIRPHPALPLERISHLLDDDIVSHPYPHMSISQNTTLKEDLEESDMVIYWGSTVAIEALMMGKPLIHFDSGDILSYDPLFECPHLKWIVDKNSNLPKTIEKIYTLSDEEYHFRLDHAREYLESYLCPNTEEGLDKFLA